jgi:D-alanyl-D-alanine carboxypeptidase
LDNALRTTEEQQEIWDSFTEKYGLDYTKKTVGVPGYSEHHTGLALDLYLIVDGKEVIYNEDLVQYPEIWAKIHEKLAKYGFILRYPEGKEHITGAGYEPWHIRYLDNVDVAKEITDKGITFEEYLGKASSYEVEYDFGNSELYTEEELKEAAVQVKVEFMGFGNCELHSLRYAGDEFNTEENIQWMNELDEGKNYTHVIKMLTNFHSPKKGTAVLGKDQEYEDYEWWLARTDDGGWQLLTWGYN